MKLLPSDFFIKTNESIKYIFKWTALSVLVGVVVGLAAVLFTSSLNWGISLLSGLRNTVWVYVMPIFGLFMSGLITSKFAPEAAGHGTDAIIKSYNEKWGKVDIIVVPVKLIASVFTMLLGDLQEGKGQRSKWVVVLVILLGRN